MDETGTGPDWWAERFEEQRPRLRAVAYRMLGSLAEADDTVQEAWLRLSRSETARIENLEGWLTTVVARECLHVLRSRRRRREEPYDPDTPDLVVTADRAPVDPEQEALLADSVSLALLLVLERLEPAERLAFVLHDMFRVPFEEIAGLVGRTPVATRQLASRARRRVREADVRSPDPDLALQRQVVDAFYAAARAGDLEALVRVLDPDVVLHADDGRGRRRLVARGVTEVARYARAPRGSRLHPVLVNGAVGSLVTIEGRPFSLLVFTVTAGRIVAIDGLRVRDRVERIAAEVADLD